MTTKQAAMLLALSTLVGQGCDRCDGAEGPQAGEGSLAAGLENFMAATSIAQARCEREQRCGNIGPNQRYPTVSECVAKIRLEWREDLNRFECPGGVVETELNQCLAAVREEDCLRPLRTLRRIAQCRPEDICAQRSR